MATPTIRGYMQSHDNFTLSSGLLGPASGVWGGSAIQNGDTLWSLVGPTIGDGNTWTGGGWLTTPSGWTLRATFGIWRLFSRTAVGGGNPTDLFTSSYFATNARQSVIATVGASSIQTGAWVASSSPLATNISGPGILDHSDTLCFMACWAFTHYNVALPATSYIGTTSGYDTWVSRYVITYPYNYAYDGAAMQTKAMSTNIPSPVSFPSTMPTSDFGSDYNRFEQAAVYINDGSAGTPPSSGQPKGWWITKPG